MPRRSAVVRIIEERRILQERVVAGNGLLPDTQARANELEQLLLDVRAGRLLEFTLPADQPVLVFLTPE
ncbi:hypothetical protein PQR05_30150 [Paraburkholderia sediminicola]|uniref:hypothetical protein n=1 Tax=Paraburkholderia sediminicola TaxID=458836 RepID=UPI0038BB7C44